MEKYGNMLLLGQYFLNIRECNGNLETKRCTGNFHSNLNRATLFLVKEEIKIKTQNMALARCKRSLLLSKMSAMALKLCLSESVEESADLYINNKDRK